MALELIGDNEISYRGNTIRKTKYKIKCRLCNNENTKIDKKGNPIWIKDKDIKGYWTGYICYKCSFEKERICYRCGNHANDLDLLKRYNHGIWTGEYVCRICSLKLMAKCRNKALPRDCSLGKKFIAQQIVAKVRNLKSCFTEKDNFNFHFDLCDPEYSRIKVRVSTIRFNKWTFSTEGMENCDTVFLICMDRNWKNVKRVYIIPGGDIHVSNIYAYDIYSKSSSIKPVEYDKFKTDEIIYNNAYHSLKLEDCPVLASKSQS